VAALGRVLRAAGDGIGAGVLAVAARMYTQVGSCGDGADKEEESVEEIEDDHDQRVEGPIFFDGCRDQVEKRQHGEYGDEHIVVDDGWVSAGGFSDHVADE